MPELTIKLVLCPHCECVYANDDALEYHIEDDHSDISD